MGCGSSKATAVPVEQVTLEENDGVRKIKIAPINPADPDGTVAAVAASKALAESIESRNANVSKEEVGTVVSNTAAKGVPDILLLMKEKKSEAEYQWWCCDAVASLCAGNEENRVKVYVDGGIPLILAAMKLYPWDENVQMKGIGALATLAASYADYIGKQGGIEAVVSSMRMCPESYQVQLNGVRAMQNLVVDNVPNKKRLLAVSAIPLLEAALDRNPEDGQLQWRGQQLLALLNTPLPEEEDAAPEPTSSISRLSAWSESRRGSIGAATFRVANENVPGQHGVSAEVAEAAKGGVASVLSYLREHRGQVEAEMWCLDAISTLCSEAGSGGDNARRISFEEKCTNDIFDIMKSAPWEENLLLKAFWALAALAPADPVALCAEGKGIEIIVDTLEKNNTSHAIQVIGVKLLSQLCAEESGIVLQFARASQAARIVKATLSSHPDDGQLQYRGVNLLEKLQPGITDSIPRTSLIRSQSMRVEEMVSKYKSFKMKSFQAGLGVIAEGEGTDSHDERTVSGSGTKGAYLDSLAAVIVGSGNSEGTHNDDERKSLDETEEVEAVTDLDNITSSNTFSVNAVKDVNFPDSASSTDSEEKKDTIHGEKSQNEKASVLSGDSTPLKEESFATINDELAAVDEAEPKPSNSPIDDPVPTALPGEIVSEAN